MLPLLMLLLRSKDFHMIRTEKKDGKSTLVLNKKAQKSLRREEAQFA